MAHGQDFCGKKLNPNGYFILSMKYVNDYPQITGQNLLSLINGLLNELTLGQPRVRLFAPLCLGLP